MGYTITGWWWKPVPVVSQVEARDWFAANDTLTDAYRAAACSAHSSDFLLNWLRDAANYAGAVAVNSARPNRV